MTMSLVRGMTSLNTKKRKATKMTAGRLQKLQKDHREHNKYMKRIHAHSNVMTFDEYVEYVSGNYKPTAKAVRAPYVPPKLNRETPNIPSLSNNIGGSTARKESMKYTGERKLLGIATMHKSNMVPIFADNKEEAIEIAQMRRN